jgi:cytoskeletal protein RodZ
VRITLHFSGGATSHPQLLEIVGDMTLGEVIRKAREDAGLSIDELAHIVVLRSRLITEMESNNFAQCGGDAYARGHLRNIALATNASSQEFIALYNAEHSTDSKSIHSQLVDNNAAAIKSENRRLSWKSLVSVSLSIVVLIGVVQFALNNVEGEDVATPLVSESPEPSTTPSVAPSVVPSETLTPATEVTPATSGVSLVITAARGDSRIHVVASGETLFRGPLRQGEAKSFSDQVSIAIYLSNAGDLDLTLNGEKLAPLGGPNEEIRKTFRAK